MTNTVEINIPFAGFYNSIFDSEIDYMIEREIEYLFELESDKPKELRLEHDDIYNSFWDLTIDYDPIHNKMVESYVDDFSQAFENDTGIELKLDFKTMASPKEYNFETDRIFANVPFETMQKLFEQSTLDNHAELERVIKDHFTSYDGFISFYSNKLKEWLDKPLDQWDQNELGTLLISQCDIQTVIRDSEYATIEYFSGNTSICEFFEYSELEESIEEKRNELIKSLGADYVKPTSRCEHTLELQGI